MISTLTYKQLAANKLRFLATGVSIVLGVSLLSGTLILTDTIRGTLNSTLAKADEGTDAYIRGVSPIGLGYGESGPPLDASLIDAISQVDGVDQAALQVSGYAQIVDHKGKAIGTVDGGLLGTNWVTVPQLNPFQMSSGRPPVGPSEIAIDKHSADTAKMRIGDRTTVLSKGQPRSATIVGITRFADIDTPGALSVVLFDDATAQEVLNEPGQVDAIAVTAKTGVSSEALVARLTPAVGAGIEVLTGAQLTKEHQTQIGKDISQFGMFLTMFALISLFVGAFIINNTFSIIVSQRTKEMALMRAIGASGRQVRTAILVEAMVTGVVASVIGVLVGVAIAKGLQTLLRAGGVDLPIDHLEITAMTKIVSIVVGSMITLASAVFPARRASKVLPIAAMHDVAQDRSAVSRKRVVAGAIGTTMAAVVLLVGVRMADPKVVGAGAVALFLAASILGPVFARPFASVVGSPIARLRGTAGSIAQQNAMRNPSRSARTASSLMIGVALVSFLTIFAASLKSSGAGEFRSAYRGNVVIDSGANDSESGLSPQFAAELKSLPGVRTVAEQRNSAVEIDGSPNFLTAYDTSTIGKLFDLGTVEGDLSRLGADGIAVRAKQHSDVKLGDTRKVTFPTGEATFTVRAIYNSSTNFFGGQFVDLKAFEAHVPVALDARIYVAATDTAVLDRAASPYPTAKVLSVEEFIDQQNGSINTILTLMYVLLGLAVVIALLGIANTLALSIHERKRELGLLRAVGMSRGQVRSSVRWESVIVALFGTGLGLSIGVFLGWAMVRAIADDGFGTLVVPFGTLSVIAIIAALAGVGAAVMPARRAARIDILQAIATA